MATFTSQSKNTAVVTNQGKDVSANAIPWNEATDSWERVQGTWDNPGRIYSGQTKNTAIVSTTRKSGEPTMWDDAFVSWDSILGIWDGIATSWTPQTKNTSAINNQTKN